MTGVIALIFGVIYRIVKLVLVVLGSVFALKYLRTE